MRFELDHFNRNAPDDELIADLRALATKLGQRSVTRIEQDKLGRFSANTFLRRFGSWANACTLAGLEMRQTLPNTPEEELFKNLEELWIALGRQPLYSEVTKNPEPGRPISKFSVATYEKRFGGWRKALESFVTYINEEPTVSSENENEGATGFVQSKPQTTRHINWRLRFVVMRRDHFKCKVCGRSPATDPMITLDVDHIKAWSKGGPTVLENLQTLCTQCNIGKSDLDFVNETVLEVQNAES